MLKKQGVKSLKNELVDKIVKVIDDKFGEKINVIDFEHTNPFCDYFVISEVNNVRQIEGIVNEFIRLSKEEDLELRAVDGKYDSGWVVIDLYDVVVHVFEASTRAKYELDKLFMNYPHTLDYDL